MSENISQAFVSRLHYNVLRDSTGCPPVQTTVLGSNVVCTVKGTDFEIVSQKLSSLWENKVACIIAWVDAQDLYGGNKTELTPD